jgi:hypothetical protein
MRRSKKQGQRDAAVFRSGDRLCVSLFSGAAIARSDDRLFSGARIVHLGARRQNRPARRSVGSDAVLCQVYGRKTWRMYSPEQAPLLQSGDQVVDLDKPDAERFPRAAQARPTFEFMLEPGETIYVPHGWYHAVHSDSDCISLRWNFVHSTGADAFAKWLEQPRSKIDDDVLRFFFQPALEAEVTTERLKRLVVSQFSPAT